MTAPPLLLRIRLAATGAGALVLLACPSAPPSTSPPPAAPVVRAATDDSIVAVAAAGAQLQVPGRVVVGGARAVVAAPMTLRLKRVLVLPGDAVDRGTAIAEVAIPEVAGAAATLRGARARRTVAQQRSDWLAALRQEGVPRVADELEVAADLAELDAAIASSTAVLRVADAETNDAALDDLAARGTFTLRAPIAGNVVTVGDAAAGVVVGAVLAPGTVLCTIAADGSTVDSVRVIVRLPVSTPTPNTATALVGTGLPLRALPGKGSVDLQDGANDRAFAVAADTPAADGTQGAASPAGTGAGLVADLVAGLVDGQGITVTLPMASSPDQPAPVRVPAAAVRLGGDGVAEVAEVHADGRVEPRAVQVLGRLGTDLVIAGLPEGSRLKRDARAALTVAPDGEGHAH